MEKDIRNRQISIPASLKSRYMVTLYQAAVFLKIIPEHESSVKQRLEKAQERAAGRKGIRIRKAAKHPGTGAESVQKGGMPLPFYFVQSSGRP